MSTRSWFCLISVNNLHTVKRQKIRGVLISWWAPTHEINTPRKYSKYLLLVRPNCPPTKITSNEMDLSPQTTKLSSHELLPFYSISELIYAPWYVSSIWHGTTYRDTRVPALLGLNTGDEA